MQKPDHAFFVCASFRVGGDAKGVCTNKGSGNLLGFLESEITDRGLNASVTSTGCLNMCKNGPVMIDYPTGRWFGEVDESKIEAILDAIEDGESTEEMELG